MMVYTEDQIESLNSQIRDLIAVLSVYADESNYTDIQAVSNQPKILSDGGFLARCIVQNRNCNVQSLMARSILSHKKNIVS